MGSKVFNDSIHGLVKLHPRLVKIIDTPEFQRLRNIKQLGGAHFVYPGATHNRFQHSIGTCYLAGKLARRLQTEQGLGITEEDVLCVEIAALCHDLGHGPFSHLFDQQFLPRAWEKHEKVSCNMLDYLLTKNNLKNLIAPGDLTFVKDLILGRKDSKERRDKRFLFDIVNNTDNSIDVNHWDYFARDCHHLCIKNNFDYNRLLLSARVKIPSQICYRDKELSNIYDMFRTRYMLHKRACQHSVVAGIEEMITDAFLEADEHFTVKGSANRMFKLSEAITDMEAYSKLTDHVFEDILYSSDERLGKASAILRRIVQRDLYKLVGVVVPKVKDLETAVSDCEEALGRRVNELGEEMMRDVVVKRANIGYGMTRNRSIAHKFFHKIKFYRKSEPDIAVALWPTVSSPVKPKTFSEKLIRVYVKNNDIRKRVKAIFDQWRVKKGLAERRSEI
ncbi:deoxynucleoside triphosphate triphosphohydrolase SAMHD1-like [Neosynchiropus ocellatus]